MSALKLREATESEARISSHLKHARGNKYTVFYASTSFSPTLATSPIRPLKPFFKDVEPTAKELLGTGCYGSVVEVRCKSTGGVYAAKKFQGDFVKERNFEKKFNMEFWSA